MSVTAILKVILQADETVVAEAEDPVLWQKVLLAINKGGAEHFSDDSFPSGIDPIVNPIDPPSEGKGALGKFAKQLGIAPELVEGACAPSTERPFMQLDPHCWEEMKRQTPERGTGAYSPIAVAATLLAQWFRAADLGNVTQAQALAVLGTINIRDRNASRGIQRSQWLQTRSGGSIVLNPAQVSRAVKIAKSFCTKDWSSDQE